MTEEQIKQNALEYAIDNYGEYDEHDYTDHSGSNMCHAVSEKAFIAGAHSRDAEIKMLQDMCEKLSVANKRLEDAVAMRDKRIAAYSTAVDMASVENAILRDRWISVDDRLPEIDDSHKTLLSKTVFVKTYKGDGTSARYDHATKTWCPAKILQGLITHWMPIQ